MIVGIETIDYWIIRKRNLIFSNSRNLDTKFEICDFLNVLINVEKFLHCILYFLDIIEGHSFIMLKYMRWELRCNSGTPTNIIYYLKCKMCKKKETYIGKALGDIIV